jgi:acyl-CoA thioesterase
MIDLNAIREKFTGDRFATELLGAEILEAEPGRALCRAEIRGQLCNALGNPMGGALFTLADLAFAVASNCGGRDTVTLDSAIHFLRPARGKTLFARAETVKEGRSTCLYQITVTDELDTQVAVVMATGYHLDAKKG